MRWISFSRALVSPWLPIISEFRLFEIPLRLFIDLLINSIDEFTWKLACSSWSRFSVFKCSLARVNEN
jgi:hypothetical protein